MGGPRRGRRNSTIMSQAPAIFRTCVEAIRQNVLIERQSRSDKEFHFQNWFQDRLQSTGMNFEGSGRNTYPDFGLVAYPEGYELKGLAYPGRDRNYDANSQMPCGEHNGRQVYYVFGRYPKEPDGDTYPVLDLVVCHGSFLNADNTYDHKNHNFKGFGSYGDIMVRDRKMYVPPTPYALVSGAAHHRTLIMPEDAEVTDDLTPVGTLVRREVEQLVVAYSFDLRENRMATETIPNPTGGREHKFTAYRLEGDPMEPMLLST